MIKILFTWIKPIPIEWPAIVEMLRKYKPKLYFFRVPWKPPINGIKCNTNWASRVNPRVSSYGFYFRSTDGDLIYPQAWGIGEETNTEAEARALLKALRYYKVHRIEEVLF